MAVRARLRFASGTDQGKRRTNNEDRHYIDAERGIFAVIDGVGGHAAGEHAADLAVEVLKERLERQTGTPEERLREAIALANNEIHRQALSQPEWNGMACVLTVALIEDDMVTVGHVGDSRLYLLLPGEIRKMTHDHSPVGEREDRGEITEAEAMRHPRRNEIYRDVGSVEHQPDDPSFIEIVHFPMPSDGAILICSDGLTDLVTSAEILAGVERYAPDYDAAIAALVGAANQAGGKDNITIAIVAGAEYKTNSSGLPQSRQPPAAARKRWPFLLYGLAAGLALGSFFPYAWNLYYASTRPRTLMVGAAGIEAALALAHSGDTVVIPPGRYKERVQLREGVTLRAQQPSTVTLISPDGGPAVVASRIEAGGIEGVWIQGDLAAPARAGIEIVDASPTVSNVRITGALTGIEIRGASAPAITFSQITNNPGAGIEIGVNAKPKIESNLIAANGNGKPGIAKPGVEVHDPAQPLLKDNGIIDNAAEAIRIYGHSYLPAGYEENFFGGIPAKKAIRLMDDPEGVKP